jgi:hypothetical protein
MFQIHAAAPLVRRRCPGRRGGRPPGVLRGCDSAPSSDAAPPSVPPADAST